jgi:hypothetical protein
MEVRLSRNIATAVVLASDQPANTTTSRTNHFETIVDNVVAEIADLTKQTSSWPVLVKSDTDQNQYALRGASESGFQPLSKEEKQELMKLLEARDKRSVPEVAEKTGSLKGDAADAEVALCGL